MPDTENLNHIKDFVLGNLLIDLAQVDLGDVGAPVSDEEMAIFLQADGKNTLGERRCEQISAHLCQDDLLYQRWLMMVQVMQPEKSTLLENESIEKPLTPDVTSRSRSLQRESSSVWGWFSDLLLPKFGLAPVAGIMLVSIMATYFLIKPLPQVQQFAVMEGEELPIKASQDSIVAPGGASVIRIPEYLECVELNSTDSVCVSMTLGYQNWFLINDSQLKAIPPPIVADKITSLYVRDNQLLIEYGAEGMFKLVLIRFTLTHLGWTTLVQYEDSVHNGYFEQIELQSKILSYDKVGPGSEKETINYEYEQQDNKNK